LCNQKPIINVILKNKLNLNLSSGIIKNKLEIKEKNIKKSLKMLKLMLKVTAFNINRISNIKNFLIQIKGLKTNISYVLSLILKYFYINKKIFLYTPKSINNKLKFKKTKAIKRRLKKKFIKM
jgi:hypothetical protein